MQNYGSYLGAQIELTTAYGRQIKENQMSAVLQLYRAKLKPGKWGGRHEKKESHFV